MPLDGGMILAFNALIVHFLFQPAIAVVMNLSNAGLQIAEYRVSGNNQFIFVNPVGINGNINLNFVIFRILLMLVCMSIWIEHDFMA